MVDALSFLYRSRVRVQRCDRCSMQSACWQTAWLRHQKWLCVACLAVSLLASPKSQLYAYFEARRAA